jgi:hypothetical protein
MATYRITIERKDLERTLALLAGTGAQATTVEDAFVDIEVTSDDLESDDAAISFLQKNEVGASWYIPF